MRGAITPAAVFYGLLVIFLVWLNLSLAVYVDDDAYIHFRIAENLLRHGAPHFNVGEPVMASSSSGWTITLFLLFSVLGINLKAVSVFNALVTALGVYVYARLAGELTGSDGPPNDLLAALAVVPVMAYSSAGLMETPLAMLVLGIGVLLYARKDGLAFLFMAAGVFFRLELAAFLVLFLAHALYSRCVPLRKAAFYGILGAAPFLIYNHVFFGTDIPHTIAAKEAVYSSGTAWFIHMALPDIALGTVFDQAAEFVSLLLLSGAAVTGIAIHMRGRLDAAALMMLSGLSVLLAYLLGGAPVFQWYVPLYALPLFFSLFVYAIPRRAAVFSLLAAAAFFPFLWDFGRTVYAAAVNNASYRYFDSGARTRKYLDVGGRLYRVYPDCTLMSSEIGGLGYSFKGYVYDACGLASVGALKHHPMRVPEERHDGSVGAIPPRYVEEVKPDIIVSYETFDRALVRSGALTGYLAFREEVFTPSDMAISGGRGLWGSKALNVYIRKEKYSGAF